jgi:hypothetical protein
MNHLEETVAVKARLAILSALDPLDTWEEVQTLEKRLQQLVDYEEAASRG